MSAFKLASFAAAAIASTAAALDRVSVDPETQMFIDSSGRTTLFHGVNVVYKVAPYIPSDGAFDPELSLND